MNVRTGRRVQTVKEKTHVPEILGPLRKIFDAKTDGNPKNSEKSISKYHIK